MAQRRQSSRSQSQRRRDAAVVEEENPVDPAVPQNAEEGGDVKQTLIGHLRTQHAHPSGDQERTRFIFALNEVPYQVGYPLTIQNYETWSDLQSFAIGTFPPQMLDVYQDKLVYVEQAVELRKSLITETGYRLSQDTLDLMDANRQSIPYNDGIKSIMGSYSRNFTTADGTPVYRRSLYPVDIVYNADALGHVDPNPGLFCMTKQELVAMGALINLHHLPEPVPLANFDFQVIVAVKTRTGFNTTKEVIQDEHGNDVEVDGRKFGMFVIYPIIISQFSFTEWPKDLYPTNSIAVAYSKCTRLTNLDLSPSEIEALQQNDIEVAPSNDPVYERDAITLMRSQLFYFLGINTDDRIEQLQQFCKEKHKMEPDMVFNDLVRLSSNIVFQASRKDNVPSNANGTTMGVCIQKFATEILEEMNQWYLEKLQATTKQNYLGTGSANKTMSSMLGKVGNGLSASNGVYQYGTNVIKGPQIGAIPAAGSKAQGLKPLAEKSNKVGGSHANVTVNANPQPQVPPMMYNNYGTGMPYYQGGPYQSAMNNAPSNQIPNYPIPNQGLSSVTAGGSTMASSQDRFVSQASNIGFAAQSIPFFDGYSTSKLEALGNATLNHGQAIHDLQLQANTELKNGDIKTPGAFFADYVRTMKGANSAKAKMDEAVAALRSTGRVVDAEMKKPQPSLKEAVRETTRVREAAATLGIKGAQRRENNTKEIKIFKYHFSNGLKGDLEDPKSYHVTAPLVTPKQRVLYKERNGSKLAWKPMVGWELNTLPFALDDTFTMDTYCPTPLRSRVESECIEIPRGFVELLGENIYDKAVMPGFCRTNCYTNDDKVKFKFQAMIAAVFRNDKGQIENVTTMMAPAFWNQEPKWRRTLDTRRPNPMGFEFKWGLPSKSYKELQTMKDNLGVPNGGAYHLIPFGILTVIPSEEWLKKAVDGIIPGYFIDFEVDYELPVKEVHVGKTTNDHFQDEIDYVRAKNAHRAALSEETKKATKQAADFNPNRSTQEAIFKYAMDAKSYYGKHRRSVSYTGRKRKWGF